MPRPKSRWFPVAQEVNRDGETWTFTDLFGDRALRTWLEILSILDREKNRWRLVDGWLATVSRLVRQQPATVRREVDWMLAKGWLEVVERLVDGSPAVLRAPNYWKFHKTEEQPKKQDGTDKVPSLPDLPSEPSLKDTISVIEFIESWNENFKDKLPCVELPISGSRSRKIAARLHEHKNVEFWQKVFGNIKSSSFLLGLGNGSWRATLDWIVANDTNCIKVYEGTYENKRK